MFFNFSVLSIAKILLQSDMEIQLLKRSYNCERLGEH